MSKAAHLNAKQRMEAAASELGDVMEKYRISLGVGFENTDLEIVPYIVIMLDEETDEPPARLH